MLKEKNLKSAKRKAFVTRSTHSMSGTRTVWLPSRDTTHAGVSGFASITASTASAPILQPCTSQADRKTRSSLTG